MTDKDRETKKSKSQKSTKRITSEQELKKFLKQKKAKRLAQEEMMRQEKANQIKTDLPSNDFALPVLPIRQGVLFPNTELVLSFGRDFSVAGLQEAIKDRKLVVLVTQKKPNIDKPKEKDLYTVGTLAVIERTLKTDDTLSALVRGIARVKIHHFLQFDPYYKARISKLEEKVSDEEEAAALASHLKNTFQQLVQMGKPVEFLNFIKLMSDVNKSEMADQIATTLNLKTKEKQDLLETTDINQRMKKVIQHLSHEQKVLEIEKDVVHKTQAKFDKHMRENILRERLKTIQKELGEYEEAEDAAQSFKERLEEANFPQEVKQKLEKEINHLASLSSNNPEAGYIRTWIETIFDLPWTSKGKVEVDINEAQAVLDKNHYGLEDVKNRVLEYIAVLQLKEQQSQKQKNSLNKDEKNKNKSGKKSNKQSQQQTDLPTILCFVGPPGVGKTSIGKAIAQALGRDFTKISLGGIRDEAEIRGHRRTYVGAMPGRIIKGIINAGSNNPVFILDEIDKVGKDFRGDPSAALLEVLDPEQNAAFEDHYLDVPYDLSNVIFITTANTLDTIPPALKDRLEIIRYPGYTYQEKFQIAKRHLLSKVLQANGLKENQINFTPQALKKIIQRYTKEAGVRELERKIGKICRKLAKQIVAEKNQDQPIKVNKKTVRELLGPEEYDITLAEEEDQVGVATGLAWTRVGGDILFIEVALTPGEGKIKLTGKLGDVMKESAQAAVTFVKAHADKLKIDPKRFDKNDIHIHVPEGAVPKDGPSAGITLATAIASAFTERPVKREIAMTGEITLRGRVLRIGGLKEKVIAAHLAGIRQVVIPKGNQRNLEEIPDEVRKDIEFHPIENAMEALEITLKE
jgi:ATP-dependent Lon protease